MGGQRVAMRVEGESDPAKNGIFYLLTDHLGSTTVTLKDSGSLTKVSELRYKPWGGNRASGYADNLTPTDRRFSGQRWEGGTGLYHFNARWYDPLTGRFTQPDTIIPLEQGVQAWDRYHYANNEPIKYTDATGHSINLPCPWCDERWVNYSGVSGFANAAFDVLATAVCFVTGCHIDREQDTITGPTVIEYTNAAVIGLFPSPVGMVNGPGTNILTNAGQTLGDDAAKAATNWLDYVPQQYREAASGSFEGIPSVETLTDDLVVYRHWGGSAFETGSPWFSTKPYMKPGNARRFLALPEYNSATKISKFIISKGTTIIRGKSASQLANPGFGSWAVGGGVQIYLSNPKVARLIEQIR